MAYIKPYQGKRGKRYRVVIRRKGYPTLCKSFGKKKLADQWVSEQEHEIEEGKAFPGALGRRKTLDDAIEMHLAEATGYDKSKNERLDWWSTKLGKRKLSEITKGVINGALLDLKTKPSQSTGKPRSKATINRYLADLSAALSEAVDADWLTQNPARQVKRRKEDEAPIRYLRDDERPALLKACRRSDAPSWLYPLVVTALGTGMRYGDLVKDQRRRADKEPLRWSDVDLDRRRIYLRTTKSGRPRAIPLISSVADALSEWGKVRKLDDDRVFPVSYYALSKPWKEACERAKLKERLRFHDLKHSVGSYLAQNGANQATIMAALGHTSLAASQRYQHLMVDHVEDALMKAMEGKL